MACTCVENSSPSMPQPQYRRPCRGTDPAESGGLFPRKPAFLFPRLKPLPLWQHYPFSCTKERGLGKHSWSRWSQGPAVMWGFRSKAASQRTHALGSGPHRAHPGTVSTSILAHGRVCVTALHASDGLPGSRPLLRWLKKIIPVPGCFLDLAKTSVPAHAGKLKQRFLMNILACSPTRHRVSYS